MGKHRREMAALAFLAVAVAVPLAARPAMGGEGGIEEDDKQKVEIGVRVVQIRASGESQGKDPVFDARIEWVRKIILGFRMNYARYDWLAEAEKSCPPGARVLFDLRENLELSTLLDLTAEGGKISIEARVTKKPEDEGAEPKVVGQMKITLGEGATTLLAINYTLQDGGTLLITITPKIMKPEGDGSDKKSAGCDAERLAQVVELVRRALSGIDELR